MLNNRALNTLPCGGPFCNVYTMEYSVGSGSCLFSKSVLTVSNGKKFTKNRTTPPDLILIAGKEKPKGKKGRNIGKDHGERGPLPSQPGV